MQGETTNQSWLVRAWIGCGVIVAVGAAAWAVWYLGAVNGEHAAPEPEPVAAPVAAPAEPELSIAEEAAAIDRAKAPTPEELERRRMEKRQARLDEIDRQTVPFGALVAPGVEYLGVEFGQAVRSQDGALYALTLRFNNAAEPNALFGSGWVFKTTDYAVRIWDRDGYEVRSFGLIGQELKRFGRVEVTFAVRLSKSQEASVDSYGLIDRRR
ncbi:MAG: hypothetical protein H6826_14400 [Planctomycetes bacterium]|nr:hypothetical protein [Planctomycetota bacterium]